jgi:hypothetical protein
LKSLRVCGLPVPLSPWGTDSELLMVALIATLVHDMPTAR